MGVTIREKPVNSKIWWVFINHKNQRRALRIGNKRVAKRVAERIQEAIALEQLGLEPRRSKMDIDYETFLALKDMETALAKLKSQVNRIIKQRKESD